LRGSLSSLSRNMAWVPGGTLFRRHGWVIRYFTPARIAFRNAEKSRQEKFKCEKSVFLNIKFSACSAVLMAMGSRPRGRCRTLKTVL
jgi:hypothetical protein